MQGDQTKQDVSIETLYNTMSKEADGTYRQMIAVCTAFLGGTLVFFEKLFIGDVWWSIYFLFTGWAALAYSLTVLCWVRWKNVEAHRHILEYFKSSSEKNYKRADSISKSGRKLMISAIVVMVVGVILIAIFAGINIYFKYGG